MSNPILFLAVLFAAPAVFSEQITTGTCPASKEVLAKVTAVRVDPCPAPSDGTYEKPCELKRGSEASISVDFVPTTDIQQLRARLAWVSLFEFPFSGLEADGCKSLIEGQQCPLRSGQTYTWSVKLPLSSAYPSGRYPLKLLLSNGPGYRTETVLCQTFAISLV